VTIPTGGSDDEGDNDAWLEQQWVGCSEDAFSDTISLQFTVSEETDELEHEICVLPENSSVYSGMLNERHDPTTLSLFDTSHLFQHCRNWMNTCLLFVCLFIFLEYHTSA